MVAAIDEEGLVTLNDELYLRHRVSEETLNFNDIFFCWGKKQASLLAKNNLKKNNCKFFITGNPRFDMLRSEYRIIFNDEVVRIKEKYGKFILINTNFGHANHFSGDDFVLKSLRQKGWMKNPSDGKYFLRRIEWQKKIFKEFKKIIPKISEKFKNYNIIVRPHPSENHENWKKIEKDFTNVLVIHSGSVVPWIIASDLLIHNGCTTAIEAFLLGKMSIAYRPLVIKNLESELPNRVSSQAHNYKELIDILDNILNKNIIPRNNIEKKEIDQYIANISGKTASEDITSILISNTDYSNFIF
jgi:surface carbohydrate biosynthesis protein